jgi:hypothetical protein
MLRARPTLNQPMAEFLALPDWARAHLMDLTGWANEAEAALKPPVSLEERLAYYLRKYGQGGPS